MDSYNLRKDNSVIQWLIVVESIHLTKKEKSDFCDFWRTFFQFLWKLIKILIQEITNQKKAEFAKLLELS